MWESLQNWLAELQRMDSEQLQRTIESYSAYGPLPGILLPLIEAFLPILPLVLFVAANANVYGLGLGILYSWVGVTAGSLLVFWIARKIGGRFGIWLQRRFPASNNRRWHPYGAGWAPLSTNTERRSTTSRAFAATNRSSIPSGSRDTWSIEAG